MTNERGYIEIGLSCAEICNALHRGMNGRRLEDLSQPVREAINQLIKCVVQVMHGLDSSLTTILIAGLCERFERRL